MGKVLLLYISFLETRENKQISSDTLTELDGIVLKNMLVILFMAYVAEKMLEIFEKIPQ